jgi:tRNA U34 5-carboxymethylaminomethyl modifying GTPase MnmE/TrmE
MSTSYFNFLFSMLCYCKLFSSGYGKCGVAVIRVSGPQSAEAIKSIGGFKSLPEPRKVILRKLKDPKSKEILDHAIIIWFPG